MGCAVTKPIENNKLKNKSVIGAAKSQERKVVLLGNTNVGKTSITLRYCQNTFIDQHEVTIGGAYQQKQIPLKNGQSVKIHIWDTGGEERYRSMTPMYYRDADAAVLVYDVKNHHSYESINYWINQLDELVTSKQLILVLVGNKSDQDDPDIKTEEARQFAQQNNMLFFETSAKEDTGIKELFATLGEELYKKIK